MARACALGSETAWEIFLTRYREKLYQRRALPRSGGCQCPGTGGFPLCGSLRHAHGGWPANLQAELLSPAAAHWRAGCGPCWRRSTSIAFAASSGWSAWKNKRRQECSSRRQRLTRLRPSTPRLREATDQALGSLAPEDKFILANYYLDDRTLAEIARLLGVHESTISRKLEKITAATRKAILSGSDEARNEPERGGTNHGSRGHGTLRGRAPPINARKGPGNRSIIGRAGGRRQESEVRSRGARDTGHGEGVR